MFNAFIQSYNTFQEHGVEDPLLETLQLVDVLTNGTLRKIDPSLLRQEQIDLPQLAQKRKEGLPLMYILGKASFMGLTFFCSPGALIPREETELLVRVALSFVKEKQLHGESKNLCLIDMGTGCGGIAVSLAVYADNTRVMAADISSEAIALAQKNVEKFDLQARVSLFCGDLFAPFYGSGYEGQLDLVVCNPPYMPTGSLDTLDPEIIEYEPRVAFEAGPYGIDFFRRLIADSLSMLKPGGILVFEIGLGQEKLVTRLLERNGGYADFQYFKDDEQNIRVISAVKELVN